MRSRSSSSPTTTRPTLGSWSNGDALAVTARNLHRLEPETPGRTCDPAATAHLGGTRLASRNGKDPFDSRRRGRMVLAQPGPDGSPGQRGGRGGEGAGVGGIEGGRQLIQQSRV